MGRIDTPTGQQPNGAGVEIKSVSVPANAKSFFAPLSQPFPRAFVRDLSATLSEYHQVIEAHLPECFIPGVMETPAPVLVMVVRSGADRSDLIQRIGPPLVELYPPGLNLDLWTLDERDRRVRALRRAKSEVHPVRVFESWWPF